MAALASVAQKHSRFVDIFQTKARNNAGIYAVRLYLKGLPRIIVVDDYVPVTEKTYNTYKAFFAQPGEDGDFWGPIMEKVWAKVPGNYQSIDGMGLLSEAFLALTGFRSFFYAMSDHS